MNRTYALVWNPSLATWTVAHEHARRRGKGAGAVLAAALLLPAMALAADLPSGGTVIAGSRQIGTPTANQMVIDQASNKLAINWQSFDIGAGKKVTFNQPGTDSIALNRVLGADGSTIMGQLDANGRVFIINPNGVLFGQGAQVNVGGLVASTLDISDSDFAAGNYTFKGNGSNARVTNNGTITAADGGSIALLGGTVSNNGVIVANQGSVALAAGNAMTLDFAGDGLLNVQVDAAVVDALVENHQLIKADGGQVLLGANAGEALLKTVVNNTGVIEAQTLGEKNGKIVLLGSFDGGTVQVAGTLDASAPNGGDGGFIETSGAHVKVADSAKVTTKAASGKTGTWLIDPNDFIVAASGGDMTGAAVSAAVQNNNFEIQTATMGTAGGDGGIYVNDAITWNTGNRLTLNAERNITINAAITAEHASGKVALKYGRASTNGGTADYTIKAPINLQSGQNFSTQKGSSGNTITYNVVNDAQALQAMKDNRSGNYAVGSNIDLSSINNWVPVGDSSFYAFAGRFDGLGHTLSNLTINRSSTDYVGLFGVTGSASTIRNIGLVGGSVSGRDLVGGLVGVNNGAITNAYATGSVSGTNYVGGLVGHNNGAITNAYVTGSVTGSRFVGGLVGVSDKIISNAYATGSVSGTDNVGGLVGLIGLAGGSISNAYATGSTTGTGNNVGGLVGLSIGTTTNSFYATTDANGNAINTRGSSNGTGKTWAELTDASTFFDWDPTIWSFPNDASVAGYGVGLPYLTGVTRTADIVLSTLFASGFGTPNSVYTITTWQQLANINRVLSGNYHFTLSNNLDQTSIGYAALAGASANNGAGWKPLGQQFIGFTGTFDGLGHTLSSLTINRNLDFIGLFGYAGSGSTIRNIGLVGGSVSGGEVVGGLVGASEGTISNVYTTGSVSGNTTVGGLVGQNLGSISNAYATGSVTGTTSVGGLVGQNWGSLSNAYATGSVTGTTYVGGLAGRNLGTISNSFYATIDANNNAINNSGASTGAFSGNTLGTGKTWNELTYVSTFAGWDPTIWSFPEDASVAGYGVGLPYLTGVTRTSDIVRSTLFAGGFGSQASAYTITTWQQLANINRVLNGNYHFNLSNDLDQSSSGYTALASATANGGAGWNPLGNQSAQFTGTFDGLGHTLSNLTINRGSTSYVGLFGNTGSGSTIRNIGLVGGSVTGNDYTGGLVGYSQSAISSVYTTASVNGTGFYTGGLVGVSRDAISNAYATGNVMGGEYFVGGLVGSSEGAISNAYATGDVTGTGHYVGGLIGESVAVTLNNVHATGSVTGAGSYLGGLAGYSKSTLQNAYATGNVTGLAPATGTADYVGGLIGYSVGTISNAYATGNVTGTGNDLGGLVGYSAEDISNAHASGSVTGGSFNSGGLVGYSSGAISNAYATGNVSGGGFTGGLAGLSRGTITSAYASGSVSGITWVGGLTGQSDGSISNAYATGSVSGLDYTGGLVGLNTGSISNAYTTGSVRSPMAGAFTGGLVADNQSAITNSFWNSATSGMSAGVGTGDSSGITAKTTTQMQTLSFFQNDLGWSIAVNANAGPAFQPRLSPSGSSTIWQVSLGQPAVIPFSSQLYSGALRSNGQTMTSESSLQTQESVAISADMLVTNPLDEHLNLQVINQGIRLPEGI